MRAIFFDVDDTLYDQVTPFHRAYGRKFAQQYKLPVDALFRASRKYSDEVYNDAMNGDISMEEMYIYRLRMAFKDFGIELAPKEALAFQAIYAEEQRRISMTPEMERALAQCIQNGAQLGIITNGPSEHQWDKVNALQLTRWIPRRRVIISAEKGIAKPDPRIFVLALESLNQRAEELFFVGDSFMSDVEGAHEAGWKTVWFNRRAHDIPQTATFMPNYTVGTEPQLIALLDEISLA